MDLKIRFCFSLFHLVCEIICFSPQNYHFWFKYDFLIRFFVLPMEMTHENAPNLHFPELSKVFAPKQKISSQVKRKTLQNNFPIKLYFKTNKNALFLLYIVWIVKNNLYFTYDCSLFREDSRILESWRK